MVGVTRSVPNADVLRGAALMLRALSTTPENDRMNALALAITVWFDGNLERVVGAADPEPTP